MQKNLLLLAYSVIAVSFYQSCNQAKKRNGNCQYEVKTYNHFPSCNIFIIDDKLILNPIMPSGKARETIHLMFDIGHKEAEKMTKKFISTFVDCWDKTSVPATDDYAFSE